jgi:SsrA-binding protein
MSPSNSRRGSGEKLIASNPNAKRNFSIQEIVEAGIALQGTEIKSLRNQSPNLSDSFVEISGKKGAALEAWLLNAHISPYTHGNIWNHEPMRRRRLLLHRHQIEKLMFATEIENGIDCVHCDLQIPNQIETNG